MSAGRGRAHLRLATATVVASTLLVALLVTWSASIGPGGVLDGEGPGRPSETAFVAIDPDPTLAPLQPGAAREISTSQTPLAIKLLALFLLLAASAAAVILLVLVGRVVWGARPHLRGRRAAIDFDVVESSPARAIAEQIVEDSRAHQRLLTQGEPREAIIACWQRFERQAARAGVNPERWETSSEFVLRILDLAGADSAAVLGLAEEFREARFSEHVVTDEARARADALLTRIHGSLDRRRPEAVDS